MKKEDYIMPRITFEMGREKWSVTYNRANEVTSYGYQKKTSDNSSVKIIFREPFDDDQSDWFKEAMKNNKPRMKNPNNKNKVYEIPCDPQPEQTYPVADAKEDIRKFAKSNVLNFKINKHNVDYKWYDLEHSYNLYISLLENGMANITLWRDNKDKVNFDVPENELYDWFSEVVR